MKGKPNYYLSASNEPRESFVARLQVFRAAAGIPFDIDDDGDAILSLPDNSVGWARDVAEYSGLSLYALDAE